MSATVAHFSCRNALLPLGTLADALAYPRSAADLPRDSVADALRAVGLPELIDRLDEEANWSQRLSIGEQQRVAFARVLWCARTSSFSTRPPRPR